MPAIWLVAPSAVRNPPGTDISAALANAGPGPACAPSVAPSAEVKMKIEIMTPNPAIRPIPP